MNLSEYKTKFETLQKILGTVKIILEIGGHYGEDTLRFYKYFPQSKIYSFEPDPRNISIFKKTCLNIDNITLIEKAVSNLDNKQLTFYQIYNESNKHILQDKYKYIGLDAYNSLKLNGSGASSLKKTNLPNLNIYQEIKVNSIRLDTWITKNNIDLIDFIWIDVQGAEKEVLLGCEKLFHRIKFIQLEYGETSYEGALTKKDTYNYMTQHNFILILDYNPQSNTGDYLFKNKLFS